MTADNIDDQMAEAYAALKEAERQMATRVPEALFVRDFLEFFRGNTPKDAFKEYLKAWYQVAGSYQAEVAVIDKAGNVLYMVPAVFNTTFVSAKPGEGAMKMADIVSMFELEKNQSPIAATNRYEMNLQQKLLVMVKGKHKLSDVEQRWLDIFARYPDKAQETVAVKEEAAETSSSQALPKVDDDEEVGFL